MEYKRHPKYHQYAIMADASAKDQIYHSSRLMAKELYIYFFIAIREKKKGVKMICDRCIRFSPDLLGISVYYVAYYSMR